jgi:hypothetical protein
MESGLKAEKELVNHLKQIVLLLTFMFAGFAVCPAQKATPPAAETPAPERTPANWKEFVSAAGGFSILFPGAPSNSVQKIEGGEIHFHRLRTQAEYSVIYADSPAPIESEETARNVLDGGAQGAVASLSGELLELKEITLVAHPGRALKAKLPDGKILRARMFLVRQRLYQIAITTPAESGSPVEQTTFYELAASKFLNSFKLAEAEKTTP